MDGELVCEREGEICLLPNEGLPPSWKRGAGILSIALSGKLNLVPPEVLCWRGRGVTGESCRLGGDVGDLAWNIGSPEQPGS